MRHPDYFAHPLRSGVEIVVTEKAANERGTVLSMFQNNAFGMVHDQNVDVALRGPSRPLLFGLPTAIAQKQQDASSIHAVP